MVDFNQKPFYNIYDLKEIISLLRSPGGCPWDKEQTHESIRMNFIEEVYEAIEAIDKKDSELLKEELGDVLMQVVFHCQLSEEESDFNFDEVCDEVCKKLIIRHPHVFGNINVSDTGEVLNNWEAIKQQTKGQTTYTETLESVAVSLPALMRAQKVGKRAAKSGFDFIGIDDNFKKLKSEVEELQEALKNGDKKSASEELGDILFCCTNMARAMQADSEELLTNATEKFINRFAQMENQILKDNKNMKNLNLEQLDEYWNQVKQQEN